MAAVGVLPVPAVPRRDTPWPVEEALLERTGHQADQAFAHSQPLLEPDMLLIEDAGYLPGHNNPEYCSLHAAPCNMAQGQMAARHESSAGAAALTPKWCGGGQHPCRWLSPDLARQACIDQWRHCAAALLNGGIKAVP